MKPYVRHQIQITGVWTAHAYVERISAAFGPFTRNRIFNCLLWDVGLTFYRNSYRVTATTAEAELWLMLNPSLPDTADLF